MIEISKNLGLTIVHPTIFEDFRGQYTEIYNNELIPKIQFIQDDIILSTRGVLRGYHGDYDTWKYITCLYGSFELSIVDINPESSTYEKTETMTLSDRDKIAVLVPPKYVNAHQCISGWCLFFYKQTTLYTGEGNAYTVMYNEFGVNWPLSPILSDRDKIRAKPHASYIKNGVLLKPEEVN